ncbi:hypothetical protein F5B22DRAFT_569844 [Xylaria bambusicola]|uniref:uncharacterized protein n=1 Tax=Xylaria bambusicola TaxID=326684 RepID=UPI0020075EE4|nr:uncharacterized protein F5B22DRAFT_569844 [Xylaria bambusicola]KAI0521340.1 hypothetical protein F5B22DRAFT_569844 [Xylaria bambusicola]
MGRLYPQGKPSNLDEQYFNPQHPFTGQNTYLLYQSCQKRFITWLVKAAAELGAPLQIADGEKIVCFTYLCPPLSVIAARGKVPPRALAYFGFISKALQHWHQKPDWMTSRNGLIAQGSGPPRDSILATLEAARRYLAEASITRGDDELVEEDYSLPILWDEAYFAWRLFFDDLDVVKKYLVSLWREVREIQLTLISAAFVTNTAIRLIRANCEAQIKATAHLPGMPNEHDITEWVFNKSRTRMYNMAGWCCRDAQKIYATCGRDIIQYVRRSLLIWIGMGSASQNVRLFGAYLRAFLHDASIKE